MDVSNFSCRINVIVTSQSIESNVPFFCEIKCMDTDCKL